METDFARQYYEAARSDHWWFRGRADLVNRLVEHFALLRGLVLDLGAGSSSLFSSEFEIIKLDIVRPVGDLNRFVRASATSLPFDDRTFQGVGAFDLIEHIADTNTLMGEVFRVITPGGFLLATVPAHQFLWSAHDARVGHVRRYNLSSLRAVLLDSGFDIVWSGSFYGFLLLPALMRRLFNLQHDMGFPREWLNKLLGFLAVRSARRAVRGSRTGLSIGVLAFRPR